MHRWASIYQLHSSGTMCPMGFSPCPEREVEKPAAAQLLKPRVLFWLNFSLEALWLKMITCLLENTGYGTQGREWARGPDNMALPDTTKHFLFSGRVFPVGILSSLIPTYVFAVRC